MLFQTLDDKSECVGIYVDSNLLFSPEEFPEKLSRTWTYAPYLKGKEIEYASLYLQGKPLVDHIPEYLQDDWDDVYNKLLAFRRSFSLSQVDTRNNCFYDLVPERFLIEYCEVKNKITDHILKTIQRPDRYEFLVKVCELVDKIKSQPVLIDRKYLKSVPKGSKLFSYAQKILSSHPSAHYNQFGTRTGRLTTRKGTLPILTLPSGLRRGILPQNDFFVELDFNGAEVRTLLGLLQKPQPKEDIHTFHQKEIFNHKLDRSSAKVAFFGWLYGSKKTVTPEQSDALNKYYDKSGLLKRYWKDNQIVTPYKKIISNVDKHHALNYLVQSTAAELLIKQCLKISYLLEKKGHGSHVSFMIHDSIILDMKKEDLDLLDAVIYLMSSTNFGDFTVNRKKGHNLGDLNDF